MKIFNLIKAKYASYILRRDYSKITRTRRMPGYAEARSFALFFQITRKEEADLLKNITKSLRADQKNVHEIVFVADNQKQPLIDPAVNRFIFEQKDLNWFAKPSQHVVDTVSELQVDYLIDFTTGDFFPFIYLVAISKAKVRMGIQSEAKTPIYDFMITSKTDNAQLLAQYLIHYLKIINAPHHV